MTWEVVVGVDDGVVVVGGCGGGESTGLCGRGGLEGDGWG